MVTGAGPSKEQQALKQKLVDNALAAILSTARQPGLRIVKDLAPDERAQEVTCWTIESETLDRSEVLFQSVLSSGRGVLLVTFEGYNSAVATAVYDNFIRSVRVNPDI
jgi:hypothetical protein